MSYASAETIVNKAMRVLENYPLCDNCLGRMFALLGRGLTNRERGWALKTAIVMQLHDAARRGDRGALERLKKLAPRLGPMAWSVLKSLGVEAGSESVEACYICGGLLADKLKSMSLQAVSNAMGIDFSSFLVAARIPEPMRLREEEVKQRLMLASAESIGSEVKREISKHLQAVLGVHPDFQDPDILVEADLSEWSVEINPRPLLLKGRYWKLARGISQSVWLTRHGRRYPFSVEDAAAWAVKALKAASIVLHGSGREDVDVRMLGTGRPFVLEVKKPLHRLDPKTIGREVNTYSRGLVEVELVDKASRKYVAELKSTRHSKIYKALIVVNNPIDKGKLDKLVEHYKLRLIRQRTPRRVRHRRPDIIRERYVYSVSARQLSEKSFEALIHAESGLYIKELVSGDNGDTRPSFSETLGTEAYCASLDVIAVLPERPGLRR